MSVEAKTPSHVASNGISDLPEAVLMPSATIWRAERVGSKVIHDLPGYTARSWSLDGADPAKSCGQGRGHALLFARQVTEPPGRASAACYSRPVSAKPVFGFTA